MRGTGYQVRGTGYGVPSTGYGVPVWHDIRILCIMDHAVAGYRDSVVAGSSGSWIHSFNNQMTLTWMENSSLDPYLFRRLTSFFFLRVSLDCLRISPHSRW